MVYSHKKRQFVTDSSADATKKYLGRSNPDLMDNFDKKDGTNQSKIEPIGSVLFKQRRFRSLFVSLLSPSKPYCFKTNTKILISVLCHQINQWPIE